MKGWCPVCHHLVEIHATGDPMVWTTDQSTGIRYPSGSSSWKQLVLHPDKNVDPDSEGRRPICRGSGKRV